jgi:hypothetical protein
MVKLISCLSIFLSLGGCFSPGSQAVINSINQLVQANSEVVYDDSKMRSTGAGVLKARFGERASVYMGLHSLNSQMYDLLFVSNDGVGLELYNGHIRSTVNLRANLQSVVPLAGDPFFQGFKNLHPSKTYFWKIHSSSGYSLIAQSRYRLVGSDAVETAYGLWDVSHWIEQWSIEHLDYQVENHFWVTADGIVLQSIQKPLPDTEVMDLLLFSYKPVAAQ